MVRRLAMAVVLGLVAGGAAAEEWDLSCHVDFSSASRVLLSSKPIAMTGTFSLGMTPEGSGYRMDRLLNAPATPSYAHLRGRARTTMAVFVPPTRATGFSFDLPANAVHAACESASMAAARADGAFADGGQGTLERYMGTAYPRTGLALRYGGDGAAAVDGSLYFYALTRSGDRFTFDRQKERLTEYYLADLLAVLPILTPPFRQAGALPQAGTWRRPFAGFAGVVKKMILTLCGEQAEGFVADASCQDPVLDWTAATTAAGLRLTGRLVAPCDVMLKKKHCLRLQALERTAVIDPATGRILEDGGSASIRDASLTHPLFSVTEGVGQVSFRLARPGAAGPTAALEGREACPTASVDLLGAPVGFQGLEVSGS